VESKIRFVVITGLSGAGKSHALRCLEDLGYFCIDNLPPALIPKVSELCARSGGKINRVAVVSDVRGGEFFDDLAAALNELEGAGFPYRILFLEADDETLVNRFKETRRRHPIAEGTVLNAIRSERRRLAELRGRAHIIIDTSELTIQRFQKEMHKLFSEEPENTRLMISVVSFGFKYGLPMDADLVFDVRFLPNPHYVDELKSLSGERPEVQDYVLGSAAARSFLKRLTNLLLFLIPQYISEGKTNLTIAVGCTGGQHRSITIAKRLAERLHGRGYTVLVDHRDLGRNQAAER
jgi:UPF0042 nucleotide-binding protein